MRSLAIAIVLGLALISGSVVSAQEAATSEVFFPNLIPEAATSTLDASAEMFNNLPQSLLLANQGFMAVRNRQFDQAIQFYTQAAQQDAKYNDMLEYVKNLRNQFFVLDGPMQVSEQKLPAQWNADHSIQIWERVKLKFWLGWFKSVLPKDQGMGGGPQGQQFMYDIPQDPNQMRVPQPIGPSIPGGEALPATQIMNTI